uniref:Putative secreted protein n=1 Tax=Ixodes ricinus TaxID=34613 RepID=A0A6B0U0I0_IXORI
MVPLKQLSHLALFFPHVWCVSIRGGGGEHRTCSVVRLTQCFTGIATRKGLPQDSGKATRRATNEATVVPLLVPLRRA